MTARLADFSVNRRMLVITALAVPVGAVSACAAWVLLRLIGLITNLVFYQRVDTALVAPGAGHHTLLADPAARRSSAAWSSG